MPPGSPAPVSDAGSTIADTAARLRLTIGRLARLTRQQDRSGFSISLGSALFAVDWRGPLTLGELAAFEQLAPPTVTKIVERLESLGYVERTQDPDDRRVYRVSITPAGRQQLERQRIPRNAWLAEQLRGLDPAELHRIEAALEVLEHLATPAQRTGTGRT